MTATNGSVCYLSQNRPGPQMGMGQYERLLLRHTLDSVEAHNWRFSVVFSGRSNGQRLDAAQIHSALTQATFLGYATDRLLDVSWPVASRASQLALLGRSAALYHSLALNYPAPHGSRAVYTIHDLAPLRFHDEGRLASWAAKAVREARAVITATEFAKSEVMEILGVDESRIHVVPCGCEHDTFSANVLPANATQRAQAGVSGDYLLYAGGYSRRKNIAALLEAWKPVSAAYPELTLLMCGPQQVKALISEANVERVVAPGYLDRSTLVALIRGARALVYPSIYEGFGLPPLEAMAMGVPVVGVGLGAVREVVGDGGFLAPDGSAEALEATLMEALSKPEARARRAKRGLERAQKFSWERHARQVLEIYRRALSD